jgi:hypothetical protein
MPSGAEIIKELKAAILAIEWEITDQAMDSLLRATAPLKERWAGRKPLLVCLQVIDTLGLYIKRAKEKAHPEAIKLLPAVFAALETVVTDNTMSDARKVALVRLQVEKYNTLKGELAKSGRAAERKPAPPPAADKPREQPPLPGQAAGSPIRDLLEQKEDQAVDGAFRAIFHEMVGETRVAPGQAAAAPVPPGMPSVGGQGGPDAKEVVLSRVDDEEFPEADSLLDDFFSEDGLAFALGEDKAAKAAPAEETVAIDLGRIEAKKEVPVAPPARPSFEPPAEEVSVDRLAAILQKTAQGVTPAVAGELAAEIDRLSRQYPEQYSVSLFLTVIGSVGRHLAHHAEVAPELSRQMLQSAYDRLSHSLFTLQPPKNLLAAHLETIGDYIKWHEQVVGELAQQRAAAAPPAAPVAVPDEQMPADMTAMVTRIVRQEVAELRKELLELIMTR